jgi:DNA-binding transcriptional ArsR family regulator
MTIPAVTKHLHVLEDAGLISREVEGRVHRLQLTADPLKDAALWMQTYARFWGEQFDALDAFLKRTAPAGRHKPARTRRPGRERKKKEE